ncbi:MAG: sporulation integral membrane protein YtvI, partial [Eubacteriales bacterium]|nr:sporulation integral membrane protein YtvI [Eubacteriales bacterium]
LAFIMAWAFNPVIQLLQRRLRLTRKLFSYLLVLIFYTILAGLMMTFAAQFVSQIIALASALPSIIAQLQSVFNQLMVYIRELLDLLPPEYDALQSAILDMFATAWDWLRQMITRVISSAVGITGGIAMEVPAFIIFLTVLILASCIITTDFPNLRENIYNHLGKRGLRSLRLLGHSFRTAVLGFFRSQLIFAILDMGIIIIAFVIIGVPYPLPIALVLCFLDFIPFFGAGTVLTPWGVICIALGFTKMGLQLLLLYCVLYIIRRIFEPRVLGGATGFSSLQMLFSMYAGMILAGVTGLIIAPILWIAVVNFVRTGIFDGLFEDICFVAADISHMLERPESNRREPIDPEEKKPEKKTGDSDPQKKRWLPFGGFRHESKKHTEKT